MANNESILKLPQGNSEISHLRKRLLNSRESSEEDSDDPSSFNRNIDTTRLLQDSESVNNMAELINSICRKKTVFICLTVICLLLLVLAIIAASILNKPNKESCSLNSEVSCNRSTFYRYYGTKSDYIVGRGNVPNEGQERKKEGCKPVQLYLVSRHAIRYPDADDIVEMEPVLHRIRSQILSNFESDKTKLCNDTKEDFRKWDLKMEKEDDNRISDTGEQQALELGKRFRTMYPALFDELYDDNVYRFGFTSRERTKETAAKFAEGLFGKVISNINSPPVDDILQFHKNCDKKLKKKGFVKQKPEQELVFLNSSTMETTLDNIRDRIGLNVTASEIKMMLRTCQFQFSIEKKSVWCSVFSDSDMKVFEYLEDLDDYYNDGYGGPERNYQQACPLIQDILNNFKLSIQGEHPKAFLMFSHAGAFKKFVAALGLFKDSKPLVASGYCSSASRQWKSSLICPFNANVAFALYKCASQDYKIETLVNEKPVTVQGCASPFCPFADFEASFKYAYECNLDNVCVLKH